MKTFLVIFFLLSVNLLSAQVVHTKFQKIGNYTFEILTQPDSIGNFKVEITNIKGEIFDYFYNDSITSFKIFPKKSAYQVYINKNDSLYILNDVWFHDQQIQYIEKFKYQQKQKIFNSVSYINSIFL